MDNLLGSAPERLPEIEKRCLELGFEMASDEQAGSLLRSLVASKPGGSFLELGTGVGASLCWMMDGMDESATMISIDNDPMLIETVQSILGEDPRLTLIHEDGGVWIKSHQHMKFDLIFADAWPGKYYDLDETLNLLKPGGFYVIDDMLPAEDWPEGHAEKATALLDYLAHRKDLLITQMNWSTGVVLCTLK